MSIGVVLAATRHEKAEHRHDIDRVRRKSARRREHHRVSIPSRRWIIRCVLNARYYTLYTQKFSNQRIRYSLRSRCTCIENFKNGAMLASFLHATKFICVPYRTIIRTS